MIAVQIDAIDRHASGVSRIVSTVQGRFLHKAGQYLHIVHPGGARIPLSIASAPLRLPALELHYRSTPGNADAALLDELLSDVGERLEIDGPHGDVYVDEPDAAELWLIAGGTGVAQAFGIVEHLRGAVLQAPVHLLWSVTSPTELYCEADLRAAADWLDFHPVIDAATGGNAAVNWLQQHDTPPCGRIILCGGPGFVHAVAEALHALGVPPDTMQSDVFSYC
jgi:CDP-4-dehydro-6-deoxyglucose reductase